ncbi:21027_t:CDS:2 [Rhizophagus irregularis]|nr:21027_t:CDS:2 [Rhizophagus irregularis]
MSKLNDNSIKFLKDKSAIGANFKKQKLTFNYIRFCKYLDDIYYIFSNRSSLLKEEIYKLFISECSSIKSLCMDMLDYPIYQYPGVNISLSNLYELDCNIKEQNFYHELAQICRSIEKIRILIHEHDELDGLVELIEKQKQIKYICISESGENKKIAQALEKHANSIILFSIAVRTSFLYFLFPKLINLQFLKIYDGPLIHSRSNKLFNNMIDESHYDLQILELKYVSLDVVINIIQNTNGNLLKVYITFADDRNKTTKYNQAIHKYCLNIKYVTVYLNIRKYLYKVPTLRRNRYRWDIFNTYKFLSSIKSAPLTLYKQNSITS